LLLSKFEMIGPAVSLISQATTGIIGLFPVVRLGGNRILQQFTLMGDPSRVADSEYNSPGKLIWVLESVWDYCDYGYLMERK
jgi:hypothetical protein